MISVRTILVPMDFSPHSTVALDRAMGFAKVFHARIHLLHSYAVPVHGVMPYAFTIPDGVWDGIRRAAEARLEQFRERVVAAGVEASSQVSPALPSEAILAVAGEVEADWIVVGTRGHTGLTHVLLGSVAERTIRLARCPVLTAKEGKGSGGEAAVTGIRCILAPLDFSASSNLALETAVGLAKRLPAELHLFHACELPELPFDRYGIPVPADFVREARDGAARKLDESCQTAAAAGVSVESHLGTAPAAGSIVELAGELGADLIVMGTRGHTGLKHVLLGSVAERTLEHAPCSVLTVKASSGPDGG